MIDKPAGAGPVDEPVRLDSKQEDELAKAMRADHADIGHLLPQAFDRAALQMWVEAGRAPVQLGALHAVARVGWPAELMVRPNADHNRAAPERI